MRIPALPLMASVIASCAPVPATQNPAQTAQQQDRLQSLLAGRSAGQPVSCLSSYRTTNQINISDNIILFRDGATIYRTDPPGGCPGLASGRYALLTRNPTSQLCRGDLVQLIDTQSGLIAGTCTFSDFVPYSRRSG